MTFMNQTQQETNVTTSPKKKTPMVIIIIILIVAIASAFFFGYKYYGAAQQLNTVSTELGEYKLAMLPNIQKNQTIKTVDDYYNFISEGTFPSNYKLELDPSVKLNFRDFTTNSSVIAGEYGSSFPIAYVEKMNSGKHSGQYCIFFAIPYNDVVANTTLTTRIVYVSLNDISAKLPSAATGAFIKVNP